jgi:hypothetical protein
MNKRVTRRRAGISKRAREALRKGTGMDARRLIAFVNPNNDDLFRAYVVAKLSMLDFNIGCIEKRLDRWPTRIGEAVKVPITEMTDKLSESLDSLQKAIVESGQYKVLPETKDKGISYR